MILSLVLGLGVADVKVQAILDAFNLFCPVNVFGSKDEFFNEFLIPKADTYFVCIHPKCGGLAVPAGDERPLKCSVCSKPLEKSTLLAERSYFCYSSLKSQLQVLLQDEKIVSAMTLHKRDQSLNSVVQSARYRALVTSGVIGEDDVTLQLNFDGVNGPKSGKPSSFWPILMSINELPLKMRSEKMMLLGVWMGKTKPSMNAFLQPLVEELKSLETEGLTMSCGKKIRVHCLLCPVDSPARADAMKIKNPGGKYACPWCYSKARSVQKGRGTTRIFPFKRVLKRRTIDNYFDFGLKRWREKKTSYKGVKGTSLLSALNSFDIINGFNVEYMHAYCIGIFNQILEALTGTEFNTKDFSIRKSIVQADELILKILPPHELTRLPEKLSNYKSMKASLRKNLFLYFLIPILAELKVPKTFLDHLFLLIYSLRKYLQQTLSAEESIKARNCLLKFHEQLGKIYNEQMNIFNVHISVHVPDICEQWGALWDSSTFSFESKNGFLAKLYHGTVFQPDQILRNYTRRREIDTQEILTGTQAKPELRKLYDLVLTNNKSRKRSVRVENCVVVGGLTRIAISKEVQRKINSIEPFEVPVTTFRVQRFIIKGIVGNAKSYTRMKKRRNHVFYTKQFGAVSIEDVFLCTFRNEEKKVIAIGKKLHQTEEILAGDHDMDVDSRDFIRSVSYGESIVIDIEEIQQKLVCFDVGKKTYITKLVNSFEGD